MSDLVEPAARTPDPNVLADALLKRAEDLSTKRPTALAGVAGGAVGGLVVLVPWIVLTIAGFSLAPVVPLLSCVAALTSAIGATAGIYRARRPIEKLLEERESAEVVNDLALGTMDSDVALHQRAITLANAAREQHHLDVEAWKTVLDDLEGRVAREELKTSPDTQYLEALRTQRLVTVRRQPKEPWHPLEGPQVERLVGYESEIARLRDLAEELRAHPDETKVRDRLAGVERQLAEFEQARLDELRKDAGVSAKPVESGTQARIEERVRAARRQRTGAAA